MADSKKVSDSRPDLEDSTNVAEAHAELLATGAAQAREKRIAETGLEPVTLWFILSCALVLMVGGVVLGAGGKFSYSPHPDEYIRPDFESDGDTGPTIGPILVAMQKRGANIYKAKCNGCHASNGAGDGANFPPLAESEWVTGNTERLAQIILNGLSGPIEVAGKTWTGNMPPQAPLTAAELASLMTYIRNDFGNSVGDVVSVEQAANALKIYEARTPGQITVEELQANHDKMLEGAAIDPTMVVDFETLQPAEAAE